MAIDERLWIGSYDEDGFPPWPCPHCGRHSLSIRAGSLASAETRDSREAHSHSEWEPEWVSEEFVCLVECHNNTCREVCSVAGSTTHSWEWSAEPTGERLARSLRPRFVDPAPAVFAIPKDTPEKTAKALEAAFSLFWSDPSAALNRVRTAIESLLDAAAIQRKVKTKNGKYRRLSLHERIERFLPRDARTKTMMLAVKWLANIGSHEGEVKRSRLLEVFKLLEFILDVVVEKRPQQLDRMARDIAKRKGKVAKRTKKLAEPPF